MSNFVYMCNLGIFWCVLYSTLLHLPPLRFHCVWVWGRWDQTQDCVRLWHWQSDALASRLNPFHTRLDLIHTTKSHPYTRSHPCVQCTIDFTVYTVHNKIYSSHIGQLIPYTVTRPYAGFRHPDRMAPDQTVRGGENDYSIWSGNFLPHLPKFSVITGIFRRFLLWKKEDRAAG